MPNEIYTYEGRKRLSLTIDEHAFVSRASADLLASHGFPIIDQVSAHSFRVQSNSDKLFDDIRHAQQYAPAFYLYTRTSSGKEFYITDRIFVRFHIAISDNDAAEFGDKYKMEPVRRLSDRDILYRLFLNSSNPVAVVVALNEDEERVELADHDRNRRITLDATAETEPGIGMQWHLNTIGCFDAWKAAGYGSPEVVIGIVDKGFAMKGEEFSSKYAGWAYIQGHRLFNGDPKDLQSAMIYMAAGGPRHGDPCAGLALAKVNDMGGAGVAPGCSFFPIKCESNYNRLLISDSDYEAIITTVGDQVDVLSNSWHLGHDGYWPPAVVDKIAQAAKDGGRRGRGIVFLWAAGNENCPIQYTATSPVPYQYSYIPPNLTIKTATEFQNSLVGIPGVCHVSAVSSFGQRCHYSNYGTGLTISAPSNNAHRYLRLHVKGDKLKASIGDGYLYDFTGTSGSTPIAAGVAALIISANPLLSAVDVVSIMNQTADKNIDMTSYGRSEPTDYDPDVSWDISPINPFDNGTFKYIGTFDGTWSPWFGHGRLNAAAAVWAAMP
jgi:subtilisin family serine protease